MVQDILVWLPLSILLELVIFRVWGEIITRFEVGEVALDIARGAAPAWSRKADVGRHGFSFIFTEFDMRKIQLRNMIQGKETMIS